MESQIDMNYWPMLDVKVRFHFDQESKGTWFWKDLYMNAIDLLVPVVEQLTEINKGEDSNEKSDEEKHTRSDTERSFD